MDILWKILFFFWMNEFPFQLFASLMFFVPWKRGKSLLPLRLLASLAILFLIYLFVPIPKPLKYMVLYVLLIPVSYICFRCSFWESLFFSANAYCVQNVISGVTYSLLWRGILWNVPNPLNYYILSVSVSLIAYMAVFFLVTRRFAEIDEFKMHNLIAIMISVFVSVFAIFFVSFCLGEDPSFPAQSNYRFLTATISFLCLIVNLSNCQNKTIETENKILRLLLQKDEQQYEQAKRSMEKVNIKYHDLKKAQASDNARSMNLCDVDVTDIRYGFMTGNKTLDIVLYEKDALCHQKNIRFVCEADGKALDNMKPSHIYSIFGNAIDNSIESLEKLTDESKKELFISVIRRGEIAIIKFYNYTQNVLKEKDGFPLTTKDDMENHGYGIKSIFSIVESYGGSAHYFIEDDIFYLVLTLPLET